MAFSKIKSLQKSLINPHLCSNFQQITLMTYDLTSKYISLVTALVDQATQQCVEPFLCAGWDFPIEAVTFSQYICILTKSRLQITSINQKNQKSNICS